MRIKITKPDGTVIEAEGTAEECAQLTGEEAQVLPSGTYRVPPVLTPSGWPPWWAPAYPTITPYPWGTYSTGIADGAGATSFSFTGASS